MRKHKYVVIYPVFNLMYDSTLSSAVFTKLDDAARFAASHVGSKLYGLNPEYKVECIARVKP